MDVRQLQYLVEFVRVGHQGGLLSIIALLLLLWLVLGDNGSAVVLNTDQLSAEAKTAIEDGWNKYGHNEYVNHMISLRRTLPDVRDPS